MRSVLATIDGPVVLVGHSYGGAVIGEAARGADNVAALVFVAAYILDEGESIGTVLDPERFPGGRLGPDTTIARPFRNPAPLAAPTPTSTSGTDHFAEVFAADLPEDAGAADGARAAAPVAECAHRSRRGTSRLARPALAGRWSRSTTTPSRPPASTGWPRGPVPLVGTVASPTQ